MAATQTAEAEGSQIKSQLGLYSELKASLSKLVRSCLKIDRQTDKQTKEEWHVFFFLNKETKATSVWREKT